MVDVEPGFEDIDIADGRAEEFGFDFIAFDLAAETERIGVETAFDALEMTADFCFLR